MFAKRDINLGGALLSSLELPTSSKQNIHGFAAWANPLALVISKEKGTRAAEFAVLYISL